MWTDSHCHIGYEGVGADAIPEARAAGVTRLIDVGTDSVTSVTAVETARSHQGVWATVGLHPHQASEGAATVASLLDGPAAGAVATGTVVGVGECGLDYFYEHSPRDAQRLAFAEQIALAKQYGLALVIHTRDAWDDTWDILVGEGMPERTVFHCFTGGPEEARRALDLGAWLSFSGIITFKT
ncbi:MAG: TatD family hydrolase, partial [Acidimicrobiales bacterium]